MSLCCFNSSGLCISSSVFAPETFVQRARGLLGKSIMNQDEGMILYNCSSIHMIGMRFSIDVVYLDSNMVITKLVESIKPWRFSFCRKANHTLELAVGSISNAQLKVGEQLTIKESK